MAFMVKFLKEWNGHQPDIYQYLGELRAEVLIKEGIGVRRRHHVTTSV